jgi:ribosome-binding protein aMBF1 (putative translation factor)
MHYVVTIARAQRGWRAKFPDIPCCKVTGASEEDVVVRAHEALIQWLREHLIEGAAPAPRRRYAGPGHAVDVPGDIAFAIELRDARHKAVLFRHELAERAGVSVDLIEELETARTTPMLYKVLPIAKALGMRPVIELERLGEAVGLTRGRAPG